MKILIYSANFAPEPTGIGKYSGEMAEWFAKNGHEVRVVAAPPYYPAWKVEREYLFPPYRSEWWKGARVWRAPLWVPNSPGGTKRVLHLLSFALSSFPVMLRQLFWRPQIVLVVAPAFVCAPTAWLVARLSHAVAWLHIQDFEVDVAFKMGLLKGNSSKSLVRWLETRVFKRFDVVSSISRRMLDRLLVKGVRSDKVFFFPNWVDIDHIKPLFKVSSYRNELDIASDTQVVLFSGSLGNKQGLKVIPNAARLLQHRRDIIFIICGEGVMKQELLDAAKDLNNIKFLPLQPFERLNDLLGLANIHLLPQSIEAEDLVLPSKLSGMLSSGRPIIATCREDTEIASIVKECGLVVPPDDAEKLAEAISYLVGHKPLQLDQGKQARSYAENNLSMNAILNRVVKEFTTKLSN